MEDARLNVWRVLFARALDLIDSLESDGIAIPNWTFGGGTVLMLRHRHRLSKDIDIFVSDPQVLPYLTPRLNDKAAALTTDYAEAPQSLKLRFDEGEIDFVASEALTPAPHASQTILGRSIRVETSTEIIAKKVWHRGAMFTGRDVFDLAMIAEKESGALTSIRSILRDRKPAILARIEGQETVLREAFDQLDVLDYRRTFDECVTIVMEALA